MVQISNKPNISGIKDVSEDAEYSSKLLAREGKLFAGLTQLDSKDLLLVLFQQFFYLLSFQLLQNYVDVRGVYL